ILETALRPLAPAYGEEIFEPAVLTMVSRHAALPVACGYGPLFGALRGTAPDRPALRRRGETRDMGVDTLRGRHHRRTTVAAIRSGRHGLQRGGESARISRSR